MSNRSKVEYNPSNGKTEIRTNGKLVGLASDLVYVRGVARERYNPERGVTEIIDDFDNRVIGIVPSRPRGSWMYNQ